MLNNIKESSSQHQEVNDNEKTAIDFIIENPYQDDFVNRNYHLTNQEGNDNSIELANYWSNQYDIVINWLKGEKKK
jgi:hypothetical protein